MTGTGIAEPIIAGIIVSLINRYVFGNQNLMNCCQSTVYQVSETIDDNSSENSAINADVHVHHVVH